jgi:hypothetical protein
MKYPLIILSDTENLEDPGSCWYICFQDGDVSHCLPTTKKHGWLQKWNPENCPRVKEADPGTVLRFSDRSDDCDLSAENIIQVFEHRYQTVENYLSKVNAGEEIQALHHHGALWDLRNLHNQCGSCGNPFSTTTPDAGEGMCYQCSLLPTYK